MNTIGLGRPWQLYPAKYFGASSTYDHWCKISAADIHGLREERGFEGQNVLFHLNHPIRFVYIVAQVIAIQDIHPRIATITIDDGSGATIELKVGRNKEPDKPFATSVQNLTIVSSIGQFQARVDGNIIDLGTMVKIKGTFSSFRGERQIELKRIWIVNDTAEETAAWMASAKFKRDILLRPWKLLDSDRIAVDNHLARVEMQQKREARRNERKEQSRVQRQEEKEQKRIKYERHAERSRLATETEMNRGALI